MIFFLPPFILTLLRSDDYASLPLTNFFFFPLYFLFSFFVQLKPGGRIPEKGKRISLRVKNTNDLSRDVIKVCYLNILVIGYH